MLKRKWYNFINRTANFLLVKSENPSGWPKRWFWEFFLSFSLKAHNYYPAYHIGPDFLTKKSRYYGILFMKTFYNVVNANLLCIGSACFDRPRYWWKKSMFKRLVYTPPDLSPRFTCKVNLSKTKNPAWFFIRASLLDRGMERVHWLPPRTIYRLIHKIIFRGCPIIHSLSNEVVGETVN